MINIAKIEEQFRTIYSSMEKMPPEDKALLTDKLLAYLLFHSKIEEPPVVQKTAKKTLRKKTTPVSKKDQELLKKIADKTDELYKRLGGDTI